MTGKINFFSEGKLYAATLKINEDDSIDKTAFNQSLTSENPYTRKLKQIKEDNDRIMSYTKDKRRAKVVKKYEKECKKYRDVLESPMTGFSNLEQLISYAVKTAEIQKSYLELLE